MVNFFEKVLQNPNYFRQFNCSDSLITVFNCPLEAKLMKSRFADLWTQYNYLFYVVDGRKIWHTANKSYDIGKETCVFVRKGAWIFENFLDRGFCVVLFFIPDEFITETLKARTTPISPDQNGFEPVYSTAAIPCQLSFYRSHPISSANRVSQIAPCWN